MGVWSLPALGIYNTTEFAVEGFSEALVTEVKDFGIHVTMIEPNGYTTDFGGSSAVHSDAIPAYDALKSSLGEAEGLLPEDYGKPEATVPAILKLIDNENPKEAKNLLLSSENNVAGIAYDLGFESPSYFTRLFKKWLE